MMHTAVNARSVKKLAKSLRALVGQDEINHQQSLEVVATSLGFKASALLGMLKTSDRSDYELPIQFDEIFVLNFLFRELPVDAYLAARRIRSATPIASLIKAIAYVDFEPNAALAIARKAFDDDPSLVPACYAWPDGLEGLLDPEAAISFKSRGPGPTPKAFEQLAAAPFINKVRLIHNLYSPEEITQVIGSFLEATGSKRATR